RPIVAEMHFGVGNFNDSRFRSSLFPCLQAYLGRQARKEGESPVCGNRDCHSSVIGVSAKKWGYHTLVLRVLSHLKLAAALDVDHGKSSAVVEGQRWLSIGTEPRLASICVPPSQKSTLDQLNPDKRSKMGKEGTPIDRVVGRSG